MNTPPPEADVDMLAVNTPPPAPLTPPHTSQALAGVHCACPHEHEGSLALLLRTVDFAAWVS